MKKHLLIFFLTTLLAVGLNERNNSVRAVSADFPASAQAELSQKDDTDNVEIALEANSLFTPPATHNAVAGDHRQHNFRTNHSETTVFISSVAALRYIAASDAATNTIITRNGAFNRSSDYYVYTLRHIVV